MPTGQGSIGNFRVLFDHSAQTILVAGPGRAQRKTSPIGMRIRSRTNIMHAVPSGPTDSEASHPALPYSYLAR
jgi:hypothetical protein